MRSSPGAEGFLNRLGVQTRDASGKMRDTAAIFTGVGQKLNGMPYYRAKQYAQMLGIDENTLMAMRRGMNGFASDYQSMLQKTGFNADKAAVQSNKFMTSMRGLTSLFGIMRDKIGSNLAGGLAGSLDELRKRILDNFPKIEETLTKVIKGILWLADAFTRMAYRVIQSAGDVIAWWKKLDEGSKQFLMTIGAILVAWRLLNAAFLKSPIGLITTLIIGLGLLYDDYQTWKEGGKSLIDWSKWQPEIEQAKKVFIWLRDKFLELKDQLGGWKNTLTILFSFLAGAKLVSMLTGIGRLVSGFTGLGKAIGSSIGGLGKLAQGIAQLAIKNPWLLMFIPANNTPTTSEEIDSIRQKDPTKPIWQDDQALIDAATKWQSANPGKVLPDDWREKPEKYGLTVPTVNNAPRGIRNNNPGNIDYRGQAGASLEKRGGRFAKFETAYDGLKALSRQLMRYFEGKTTGKKLQTISDIISTWAPGNENNTGAYIAQISKTMGVSPDAVLNLKDPKVMSSLMNGIIHHENGRNPYPGELVRMAAGGGGGAQIQQETTINIHGVSDPREAARLTVDRQKGVNSQLTQQLPTVPS
ncbi:hypothetical protein D3C71_903910 [compost metagenome]